MKIRLYTDSDRDQWDALVPETTTGTFMHTRKFLSYHKDRFKDVSVVVERLKGGLAAVFPAAVDLHDPKLVVNHPGATYGGLVHSEKLRAERVILLMSDIFKFYKELNFTSLLYKPVPVHLHKKPSQSDVYGLWKLGTALCRRDLWNNIPLDTERNLSKGHKWSLNKAIKNEISVHEANDVNCYPVFHKLLCDCLMERHGTKPVHSLEDMLELREKFPEIITLWSAYDQSGELLAGTWLLKLWTSAWHTQYIASSKKGRDDCAVDILLETVIKEAQACSVKYFSFGTSAEQQGRVLNSGLFDFKAGFGSGTVVQDQYLVDLKSF